MPHRLHALLAVDDRVVERVRAHPVLHEAVEVDVRGDHLRVAGEALRLGQQLAVLADDRVAVPGEVGGGLARAGGGVEVAGDALAGLRLAEFAAVLGLADGDVAGREVGEEGGAGQRAVGAGRDGRPDVLADLDVQLEPVEVRGTEHQVVAEGNLFPKKRHFAADGITSRGELAFLIKLAVVRQERLGHEPEHAPPVDGRTAVEELRLEPQRHADQQHRRKLPAGFDERSQRREAGLEQGILMEEVLVRIGREAELGEQRDGGIGVRGAAGEGERLADVELRVRHPERGDAHGGADESVRVNRVESLAHGQVLPVGARIERVKEE
jgi:hypothetical protein